LLLKNFLRRKKNQTWNFKGRRLGEPRVDAGLVAAVHLSGVLALPDVLVDVLVVVQVLALVGGATRILIWIYLIF
jgi:hypothetical protein